MWEGLLTGGGAGLAHVSQRAVDGLFCLVPVFPQQHEADLLPQLRGEKPLLHLPLHDVV